MACWKKSGLAFLLNVVFLHGLGSAQELPEPSFFTRYDPNGSWPTTFWH